MTADITLFKQCMGQFVTGITIITTKARNKNIGITINSFNSVSLSPLLILFSLNKKSFHYQDILHSKNFTINILNQSQKDYVQLFANHKNDQWTNTELDRENTITDSPALKNCLAFLECEKYAQYEGGDHTIIVGKVINLFNSKDDNPLIYYKGNFLK